jgi:hypothetical protein
MRTSKTVISILLKFHTKGPAQRELAVLIFSHVYRSKSLFAKRQK